MPLFSGLSGRGCPGFCHAHKKAQARAFGESSTTSLTPPRSGGGCTLTLPALLRAAWVRPCHCPGVESGTPNPVSQAPGHRQRRERAIDLCNTEPLTFTAAQSSQICHVTQRPQSYNCYVMLFNFRWQLYKRVLYHLILHYTLIVIHRCERKPQDLFKSMDCVSDDY